MGLKIKKLNSKGFSSHLLVPVLVIALISGMGAYAVSRSNANTAYSNGAIYLGNTFLSPDGSKSTMAKYGTTNNAEKVTFSPDGKRVSYWATDTTGNDKLYVASSDGTSENLILSLTDHMALSQASWSHDGSLLVFTQAPKDAFEQPEIVTLRPDGSGFDIVPTPSLSESESTQMISTPIFQSDNKTIIYVSTVNGKGRLCKVHISENINSCVDIKLPDEFNIKHEQLDLSSDNNTAIIVSSSYSSCESGSCDFAMNAHKVNTVTGDVTDITHFTPSQEKNNIGNVIWSPDETKIAYGFTSGTVRGTYVSNPDGTNAKLISRDYGHISWQPYLTGTTQPTLPHNTRDISCRIDSTSAELIGNKTAAIKVTFTNNTPAPVNTTSYIWQRLWKNNGKWTEFPVSATSPLSIESGASRQTTVQSIVIPYDTTGYDQLNFNVMQENGSYGTSIRCSTTFTLPKPPVIISGSSPRVVPYNKSMTVAGKAGPRAGVTLYVGGKAVQSTTANSTGAFSTTYMPKADITFYAQAFGRNSASHVAKVRATVNGSTLRTVTKGSNVTISGTYMPGKKLAVYMRKSTDPAGKYPRIIYATVNSNGSYSFTFKADTKKVFYVQAPNGTKTSLYTVAIK